MSMLPYSVVIKGRALRATGDGTIETLSGGVWAFVEKCADFNAARERVVMVQRANFESIAGPRS